MRIRIVQLQLGVIAVVIQRLNVDVEVVDGILNPSKHRYADVAEIIAPASPLQDYFCPDVISKSTILQYPDDKGYFDPFFGNIQSYDFITSTPNEVVEVLIRLSDNDKRIKQTLVSRVRSALEAPVAELYTDSLFGSIEKLTDSNDASELARAGKSLL